jgi:signal transduction histidine kinase/DNA-binding response OmpR family regulator
LYYYDSATRKTTKYGMAQGLPNEVIYGVLPDDANSLWFSTNNGLSRFNLTSKKFNNFDASDGLLGNEFNFGAFTRLKNGHLVYGSVEGLNSFAPKGIVENSFIPSVAITALKVNNKPYYIDPDNVGELVLRHNQNVLNFEFVALSYSNADKNQYAYRLQGFDREWNYVKKNLGATYTNLDEGSYTFHVIASNNDKLWNEEGTKLRIRILPAPWKTWWAYLFYTGFIFGIVILIRRYTLIRIYERNQLKQERLEKERIEEVNALKLQLFTNISHDFRTPLTLIIGSLEQLLKEKSTNTFVKSQFEVMHRNANVLMQLINQLLDFRKSEFGKLKLSVSKGNLVFFIHEIKRAFEELAKVKQIEFQFVALDETIDGWFDKMHLKNVIFNLLSNAFKFTPVKGEITLQVSTKEQYKGGLAKQFAKIKIKDNGIGIAESKQKYIFDRFYHLGERTGTGIGLALTKNLVELHGGTIKVKSSESVGTCFTIILPLGQDHLTKDQFADDERYTEKANFIQTDDTVLIKSELMQYENQVISNEIIDNTSPSVLIVDDNVEVRALIKLFFKGTYNIYEAANGKSALELVQDKEIDIILSDVMMPIMDGIELCNQIKTNVITSHIPVVLLTAKSSQETQHSGYRLGADLYITKPFDINILELRIANLLKLRKRFADKFKKDIILEPKELTFTSTDELFLKNVIDIVNKNLTNPNFNMNELIDQMGVSRSVLYRKLKAITGQSASEFIKNMKLKRAAQLIMKSNMNISEIAFELGYSDLKHFRKSFKEKFNVLPSEYKHTPKDNIQ